VSDFQQRLAVELLRRGELLPREVAELKQQSEDNGQGMGIHRSQIEAIKKLLDQTMGSQSSLLAKIDDPAKAGALSREEFTLTRERLQDTLTGAHSVMAVFRHLFAQRNDPSYRDMLDAADLVAAYCYLPCRRLVNGWKSLPEGTFREPPLTYLNAASSPAAITRHKNLSEVGLALFAGAERQLPIPVISFTFHDTTAFWSLCSLYHEVGHLLSLDLGLSDALKPPLQQRLAASPNVTRWADKWVEEMVADAFGVLLGGAGYAHSLMSLLFISEDEMMNSGLGPHPNTYVRVFLLAALLRATDVAELKAAADECEASWRGFYGEPAFLKSYLGECADVADVLMNAKLATELAGRCLLDFARNNQTAPDAPDCARDHSRLVKLSDFFRRLEPRPATSDQSWIRLVPAAAQLAVSNTKTNVAVRLVEIHTLSLVYLNALPRPQFLSGAAVNIHKQYMDNLFGGFDFSALKRKPGRDE
jgi:hypothetical protein